MGGICSKKPSPEQLAKEEEQIKKNEENQRQWAIRNAKEKKTKTNRVFLLKTLSLKKTKTQCIKQKNKRGLRSKHGGCY